MTSVRSGLQPHAQTPDETGQSLWLDVPCIMRAVRAVETSMCDAQVRAGLTLTASTSAGEARPASRALPSMAARSTRACCCAMPNCAVPVCLNKLLNRRYRWCSSAQTCRHTPSCLTHAAKLLVERTYSASHPFEMCLPDCAACLQACLHAVKQPAGA